MAQPYDLIAEGDYYYARALKAIRSARQRVLLMVYIWQDDEIGRLFLRALIRKAKQAIRVTVVIDAVGSYELSENFFRPLRLAGGQVFLHHRMGIFNWNWFRFLIRRNHRKIIIVDRKMAITGGFNIMRECSRKYFGRQRWLDLALASSHVGYVDQLTAQFFDACRRASRRGWAHRLLYRSHNRAILLTRKHAVSYSMSRYLKRRFRRARHRIVISVPYFVPYGFYYRILKRKLKQGVSVEIILSETSDVPWLDRISFYLAGKLAERGAAIFLYRGHAGGHAEQNRFSHAKMYLVDGFAGIGSANYDYRSMVLNLDTLVFVPISKQWMQLVNELKNLSRRVYKRDLKSSWIARLLLPLRWLL